MPTAREFIDFALQFEGIKENPPGSNNVSFNTHYYGREINASSYAWCAVMVWDICRMLDASSLYYGGGKTASCTALWTYMKKKGQDVTGETLRPGDWIFYKFGYKDGKAHHIGILTETDGKNLGAVLEGNTSLTSDDNGGAVMLRRDRKMSHVIAVCRPGYDPETEDEENGRYCGMNVVKGSTASEKNMIKAIQSAVGSIADGEIGAQTLTDIARLLGADCFPLTVELYGMPVIIAENIVPFNPKSPLSDWGNVISGGFSVNGQPCSILVQDGNALCRYACHASYGKPESVIYRRYDGSGGIARVADVRDLGDGVRWAVGGMGLLGNYAPVTEGFTKLTANGRTEDFSDVLRDTNHTLLGCKGGYYYLAYCKSMTGGQVNAFAERLGLEYAVMLDGGHVAAINGAEGFARINLSQRQYYVIQGE